MSTRLDAAVGELVAALREEFGAPPAAPYRRLGVDEAAALLGIGRSRLYGEIQSGRLASVQVGRRRLIPAAAIRDFVDGASS